MNDFQPSRGELLRRAIVRLLVSIPLLLALFFLPAGTLAYWEAWVYLAVLLLPLFLALLYLLKNDPELLARRLRLREKEPEQKRIVRLWSIYLLLIYLPSAHLPAPRL